MILADLKIHNVRNINSLHLSLHPQFNLISGTNGTGKTSILEALHLLSCGHSFRSREISPIISHHRQELTVFARSTDKQTISIQKSTTAPTRIKLNNQYCSTTSQLAYALPCQVFYADIFQIIDAGPGVRRSLLDWGLFHVKPCYLQLWKEYKAVLRQRNALLRSKAPYSHFIPWDKQLVQLAYQLHNLRNEYFDQWMVQFNNVLKELTPVPCFMNYFKGWDRKNLGKLLEDILVANFSQDQQRGYTQFGAHQADINIEHSSGKAKQTLSRGQQKIVLIALRLAQGNLLNNDCLYLFDDFSAELDPMHQQRVLQLLTNRSGQYILTTINRLEKAMFDHGVNQFDL